MSGVTARFRDIARHVPIPRPWSMSEYLDAVTVYRGRSIVLRPVESSVLAGSGCGSGLWIALPHNDVIVYGSDTTEGHADHIILHEVGHMLFDHGGDTEQSALVSAFAEFMPSVEPDSIRKVLARTVYDNEDEREAELFADMVMVSAMQRRRRESPLRRTFFGSGTE
jgi:hypothetical protein